MNWEWLEGIPYLTPTAVWGPRAERDQASGGDAPAQGPPYPSPGPTSAGPRLLDDVFDQPVDPFVQSQTPQERDLPGKIRTQLDLRDTRRPPPSPGDHSSDCLEHRTCPAWGGASRQGQEQRAQTHRVQLPLKDDEGHKTNDDEHRPKAQVGKEVAREIAWGEGTA